MDLDWRDFRVRWSLDFGTEPNGVVDDWKRRHCFDAALVSRLVLALRPCRWYSQRISLIESVCQRHRLKCPVICTPEELP